MSGNLLTYSGITTKAKALKSDLMTASDYGKIAYFDNIVDFINYLKTKRSYETIFRNYDEQALHRSEIELLIKNSLYLSFAKLYRFANLEQRSVLTFRFFRMEVNILKSCLQNVFNNEEHYNLSLFETFFTSHSDLNISRLASAKDMDDFIRNLQGTEYYNLLKKCQDSNHNSLHDYEIQLDIYYFTKVWRLKDRLLKGHDKKAYTSLIGNEIDLLNIQWIYRSKYIYDVDSSILLSTLIPVTYKLKITQLKQLSESASKDDFLRILNSTYYAHLFNEHKLERIEVECSKIIEKNYKLNSAKYQASMAPVLYYLYQKDQEIDRLTTALECIRYKLDPTEAITFILN